MVRVLIERHFASGHESTWQQGLVELRQEASQIPGYISGETLRDVADPLHFIVISTWANRHAWEAWLASEERANRVTPIQLLLREPERVQVYESSEGKVWTI